MVHGAPAESIAAVLLLLTLAVAIVRPKGVSEALVAVPAAVLLVGLGIVPGSAALDTLRQLGPTVAFLAAILAFGHLCADAGVFSYLGTLAAQGAGGRPRRLLTLVVALSAVVTALLTLDATVVLLTPVVLALTARAGVPTRPHAYACVRLANSGSLLLPVSNLTNLLAFAASALSFGRFAALMVLPWLVVCAGEWLTLRVAFRRDLPERSEPAPVAAQPAVPRYALVVLAVTVAGFVICSTAHVAIAWAALAGCLLLLGPRAARRDVQPRRLIAAAGLGFCVFVLALAIVVDGLMRHGLHTALGHLVPDGASLPALLAVAFLAALLANLVNNLPATLALIPLVAANPAAVLAMLVGVNVGPNATFGGSLATLLWRRLLPPAARPDAGRFHLLGLLTVPALVAVATVVLWGAYRI